MAFKFIIRATQVFCAISALALIGLLKSSQAFVINSPAKTAASGSTATNEMSGVDLDLKSFSFLSDPKWRQQQMDKAAGKNGIGNTKTTSTPDESSPSSNNSKSDKNPFLRSKRDAATGSFNCTLPNNLPERVEDLNVYLTSSGLDYVGAMPQHDDYIPTPTNQPLECPAPTGEWWPGTEHNLRSTCPYIIEELALGPNAFPSYLLQAKCLCTERCVDSTTNKCLENRKPVTIKRVVGCQNGLAVMKEDKVMVTVGCFCAAPAPTPGSHGGDSLPSDF